MRQLSCTKLQNILANAIISISYFYIGVIMIVGRKIGDVLRGPEPHMAFAVNTEGFNDAGLAGSISARFWPELASTGPQRLGTVLTKMTDSKVLHALVVHSLTDGWGDAPQHIEACFNALEVPTDEEIASVAMGAGMIGMMSGASPEQNLAAMERSTKSIVVYDLG